MDPYFTVTVSYMESEKNSSDLETKWKVANCVIAFSKIEGAHNGETIADMLYNILEEYGISSKVCTILQIFILNIVLTFTLVTRLHISPRTTTLLMTKRCTSLLIA